MTLGVNDPLVSRPNRNANELVIDWRMTDWMLNAAALTLRVRHACLFAACTAQLKQRQGRG